MATPSYFTLQKKSTTDRPAPAPPRVSKKQIYTDENYFKDVDDHAIAVSKVGYRNFRDLIWNLVYKKSFNEVQKARVICRWITMKSVHTYSFDGMKSGSPDAVLQGYRNGITAHSRALECLALHAGLHCVVLSGWAKTGGERVGTSITSGLSNHSWNAIYADGNWRLLDCNWAARSSGDFEDFYFFTDPEEFIYNHFPNESVWQLCSPVRSKAEFDEYPLTKSDFFTMGMKYLQQKQGIIFTHKGILVLTIGLTKPTALIFKLKYGENGIETLLGTPLQRYMVQAATNQMVSYYFRAPKNGTYYLTVYAQPVPESLKLQEQYNEVCTFKIICENAPSEVNPYPECANSNYGPGVRVKMNGLTASQEKAILKVSANGNLEVFLRKSRPVKFLIRLKNDFLTDKALESAVNVQDSDSQVTIKCNLLNHGEYGLAIYANEPGKGTTLFTHICEYLLSFTGQDLQSIYGHVYDRHFSTELVRYNYSPDVYSALAEDVNPSGPHVQTDETHRSSTSGQNQTNQSSSSSSRYQLNSSAAVGRVIQSLEQLNSSSKTTTQTSSPKRPSAAATSRIPTPAPCSAPTSNSSNTEESNSAQTASSVSSPSSDFSCPVCFDDARQIHDDNKKLMSTICGHIFCETCINEALQNQQRCPTCRKTLSNGEIHPIYL